MPRRSALAGLILLIAWSPLRAGDAPVKIVTLGDSITKGVRPGVKQEETFPFLLQQELKKKGVAAEVTNIGVGGENTRQALARLKKAVIDLKPRVVTIMYGANDSYVDKGKKESRLTEAEFEANLRKIVAELKGAGITPLLMTTPRNGDKHGPTGAGEHPNLRLESYMKLTRTVAADTKTPLVDHWDHWSKVNASGTDIGAWTTDQIHLNARGHQEVTQTMLPTLLKVLTN